MTSWFKAAFSGASVCAALAGLSPEAPFGPLELPFPAHLRHREVFPEAALEDVALGTGITEQYKRFGVSWPPPERFIGSCCVFFRYDPDIVDYPTALVFLVHDGRVDRKWLVSNEAMPAECIQTRHEIVELSGYYDAAWCCG